MSGDETNKNWYFARVAFWGQESGSPDEEPGFLLMKYLLIEAESADVAYKNVGVMIDSLATMYSSGDWKRNDEEENTHRSVKLRPIGVYNFEPLLERIATGVEVFEETISNVSLEAAMADIIEPKEIEMIVEYERNGGIYEPIEPGWDEFFEK